MAYREIIIPVREKYSKQLLQDIVKNALYVLLGTYAMRHVLPAEANMFLVILFCFSIFLISWWNRSPCLSLTSPCAKVFIAVNKVSYNAHICRRFMVSNRVIDHQTKLVHASFFNTVKFLQNLSSFMNFRITGLTKILAFCLASFLLEKFWCKSNTSFTLL